MLEYTRATIDKIHSDFKKFVQCCNIGTPIFSIVYMIYAVVADAGFLWVNASFGVLSVAYIIFYICTYEKNDKSTKQIKKNTKRAYKYIKLLLKAYTVGMTVYGIYIATTHTNTLSAIFAVLNLLAWTLQVLFELVLLVFVRYKDLLFAAIQADLEAVTKPAKAVGDFVKKIAGKEVEPTPEPSPKSKTLVRLVNKFRTKKAEEKQRKEEKKKAEKQVAAKAHETMQKDVIRK